MGAYCGALDWMLWGGEKFLEFFAPKGLAGGGDAPARWWDNHVGVDSALFRYN